MEDPTHDKVMQDSRDSLGHPTHDKVMWKSPGKQGLRTRQTPLDLLEHLPPNQNLSVLLFYAFHQFF